MGWSLGYDHRWKRDIGYGVPAFCDFPTCKKTIDRGLAFVCGGEQPYGGEAGCGLYFCHDHRVYHSFRNGESGLFCKRCVSHRPSYSPSIEHPEWIEFKLNDGSWKNWREKNPEKVEELKKMK